MTFFARPDLSNEQFKQLSGSTLTLSGITQINSEDGLQLINSGGTYSSISATIGFPGTHVLTLQPDGSIKLAESTGSGATTVYLGASPTTCTVGGLNAGTPISGCTFQHILQTILVPAQLAVIVNPSISISTTPNPLSSFYEVGCQINPFTIQTTYNGGCVTPVYDSGGTQICASGSRTGNPICYVYSGNHIDTIVTTACTNSFTCTPYSVVAGSNLFLITVCHQSGNTVYNSCGGIQAPAYTGTTLNTSRTFNGIYPYFYGKVASGGAPAGTNRPSATAALITGGTKVVSPSTGTITINFGSSADDYIWFAIPNASTSKTCWFVSALNQGNIGGVVSPGGNLFPAFDTVSGVTTTCWGGQTYKLYISNYQTAATQPMQLCN